MTVAALDLLSGAWVILNTDIVKLRVSVNSFIIGGINTFSCFSCCLLNKNLMEHELGYFISPAVGKSKDPSSTQHPGTTPALLRM